MEGGHNGYLRLGNNNFHKRRWTLRDRSLEITDSVTGKKCVLFRLYLAHASSQLFPRAKTVFHFPMKTMFFELHVSVGTRISVPESHYCEEFGLLVNNWCIELEVKNGECYS